MDLGDLVFELKRRVEALEKAAGHGTASLPSLAEEMAAVEVPVLEVLPPPIPPPPAGLTAAEWSEVLNKRKAQ